ncbi:Anaphase-promoting complex subunit 1 [Rhizoclosmatium sp. JEL0117]|nr:Anaphase-promoting complex subunit 1 [Rhizoclosmatium sp. JEL0117]
MLATAPPPRIQGIHHISTYSNTHQRHYYSVNGVEHAVVVVGERVVFESDCRATRTSTLPLSSTAKSIEFDSFSNTVAILTSNSLLNNGPVPFPATTLFHSTALALLFVRGNNESLDPHNVLDLFVAKEGDFVPLVTRDKKGRRDVVGVVDALDSSLVVAFNKVSRKHELWIVNEQILRAGDERGVEVDDAMDEENPFLVESSSARPPPSPVDDNDALTISVNYTATRIWSEPSSTSAQATETFISHDYDSSPILWLARSSKSILSGYKIKKVSPHKHDLILSHHCDLNAVSAQPVNATRKDFADVLYLDPDGRLRLWTGRSVEINIPIPGCLFPSVTPQATPSITTLSHGVLNRVSVSLSTGTVVRFSLTLQPHSRIVQDCTTALSQILPGDLFDLFHKQLIEFRYFGPESYGTRDDEWNDFLAVLFYVFGQRIEKMEEDAKTESDWEFMMRRGAELGFECVWDTGVHEVDGEFDELYRKVAENSENKAGVGAGYLHLVLVALHLLLEGYKVDGTVSATNVEQMTRLLVHIATWIGWTSYVEYYARFGVVSNGTVFEGVFRESITLASHQSLQLSPPSILDWIQTTLKTLAPSEFPTLQSIAATVPNSRRPIHTEKNQSFLEQVVAIYTSFVINGPSDCVKVICEYGWTRETVNSLPFGVAIPLQEAIDACRRSPKTGMGSDVYKLIGREDIWEQEGGGHKRRVEDDRRQDSCDLWSTGVEIEESEVSRLRFRMDDRLDVVQGVLKGEFDRVLSVKVTEESSEEVIRTEQQQVLLSLSHKLLSLPLARAIFTYSTSNPLNLPETFPFPALTVSAKLPPLHETVHLDPTTTIPPNYTDWPHFHNGCATALRIPSSSPHVTPSWILEQHPSTGPTSSHAGFLLGIGLLGYLRIENWQVMLYLRAQHPVTCVGVLLGLGASWKGTRDVGVTKVIGVHVPWLVAEGKHEVVGLFGGSGGGGVSRSAAVVAVGLVWMGSAVRRYVEELVDEVGCCGWWEDGGDVGGGGGGFHDRVKNQEGHCVAAGIALGLVVLGKGRREEDVRGLQGVRVVERLTGFLNGKGVVSMGRIGSSAEVSAAGAAIALGLMYLKSGNVLVADKLRVPETKVLLDYVRSDLLLIRTLCRSLILWDDIEASVEWIEQQVPSYIQEEVVNFDEDDGRLESLKHARYYVLAGACLALAIKSAGSLDESTRDLLIKYLQFFQKEASFPAITYREKRNKSVVRSCGDVLVLCLGIVMAGSGDVVLLKLLCKLTDRVSPEVSYGSHMALQMSLGFLFLGGGSGVTLGTSDEAVAGLLCAVYPRFPMTADDNCCHLQALRHMWVLAVDRSRSLVARDVDSRSVCPVPVVVRLKDQPGAASREVKLKTPCILPELDLIDFIKVDSERYLTTVLENAGNSGRLQNLLKSQTIYVKRKMGHLDYVKDPKGQMSILARSFPTSKQRNGKKMTSTEMDEFLEFLLDSFSQDSRVQAFAQELCIVQPSTPPADVAMSEFCLRVLRECLVEDKAEAVGIYLELYLLVKNAAMDLNACGVYNLELLSAFQGSVKRIPGMQDKPLLLSPLFVGSVKCQIASFLYSLSNPLPNVMMKGDYSGFSGVFAPNPTIFKDSLSDKCRQSLLRATTDSHIMVGLSKRERKLMGAVKTHTLLHPSPYKTFDVPQVKATISTLGDSVADEILDAILRNELL